jgi:hypothetical protein
MFDGMNFMSLCRQANTFDSDSKHHTNPKARALQTFKTKMEGMVANVVSGELKGAMHEKMARPTNEK